MRLVLDAGALIAVERGDSFIAMLLRRELMAQRRPHTHGGIVGQVWRDGSKQVWLTRLLRAVDVLQLDLDLGRRAGILLGRSKKADVIDAALVLLARDGDRIVTSDADDLRPLAEAAGVHVELVEI
jgi:hypothetical protein